MNTLWQDLRYGARMLLKKPGFTLVAVITLALGIGANTAIFSVVNAVLLRPLPYTNPEALVSLFGSSADSLPIGLTELEYAELRKESGSFAQIAVSNGRDVTLTGADEPERVPAAIVSANYFDLLGVRVAAGRGFAEGEDLAGKNNVVILSHGFWQRRYGGRPSAVGEVLTLNGNSCTIIGVLPSGFRSPLELQFAAQPELWIGYGYNLANPARGSHTLIGVARLREGVGMAQAQAETNAIIERLAKENSQNYPSSKRTGLRVSTLHREIVGNARAALLTLLAAVVAVLLIACANLANLLLARGELRAPEIAVRAALGAGRWRIIRQLLTESLLLAVIGSGVGILLAQWGIAALIALSPGNIPRLEESGLEQNVLWITLLVTLLTGVICGLIPALQAAQIDLHSLLKSGGRTLGGQSGRGWLRKALVVAETALALVLLVCASLLLRSFWQLQHVNTGFNSESLLTMRLTPPAASYQSNQQVADFYEQLLERTGALPGVRSVAVANAVPLSGDGADRMMEVEGQPYENDVTRFHSDYRRVSPTYFTTLGMRLVNGRFLANSDQESSLKVAVINETLARRQWPNEDPLGKRLRLLDAPPERATAQFMTVVGVVADAKNRSLSAELRQEVYIPLRQQAVSLGGARPSVSMVLMARTGGEAAGLTNVVRQEVRELDSNVPITQVRTMEQMIDKAVGPLRFSALLLTLFALVALSLGVIGIYGVMSYTVAQRTREIGIRLALGAQTKDVLRAVIGQGMKLALAGVMVGLATSFALTQLMKNLLFGISAADPLTYGVVAVSLTLVALVACYIPARRATRVDPMVALRYE
ncbi:MAG: ABC transporter permease [Acidobacteriota bacterium]|nr:ABC transporter permease [Acidobacteriota bacterium]